jgi:uncharacterized membrane protein
MLSSPRTARRLGLSAIVLTGLLAGTAARAEPVKPQDLEETRQTCMASCTEQTGNPTGCKAFCDCSTEGMAAQITQQEYDAGKTAIATKQPPAQATVEKLTAISKTCRPQLENN